MESSIVGQLVEVTPWDPSTDDPTRQGYVTEAGGDWFVVMALPLEPGGLAEPIRAWRYQIYPIDRPSPT